MNKYILPSLIILGILFFSLFVYQLSKDLNKNSQDTDNISDGNFFSKKPNSVDSSSLNNQGETGGSGAGGGGGGGAAGAGGAGSGTPSETQENQTKELPSDINTASCGLYFKDYGVCAGYCPEGNCVSETRSCYCKK